MSPNKPTASLRPRFTSWRVYAVDALANWGITLGGLLVIVAVIGMLTFIGYQVFPLFAPAESGKIVSSEDAPPLQGATLALNCDEYRRIGVRINDTGTAEVIALSTGHTIFTYRPEVLGGARATCASVSSIPSSFVTVDNIASMPLYHVAVGTDDGRVLLGDITYITNSENHPAENEPAELAKLRLPTRDEFSSAPFVPDIAIVERELEGKKAPALIERRMENYGEFRYICVRVRFERALKWDGGGERILDVESAAASLDGGSPETVTVIRSASGRVSVITESFTSNMMTGELELDRTDALDLTPLCSRPCDFIALGEERKRIVLASRSGIVDVLVRNGRKWNHEFLPLVRENQDVEDRDPYVPADIFAAHEGSEPWKDQVAEQRQSANLPSAQGELVITDVEFALGDESILFADSHGGLQQWFGIRPDPSINDKLFHRIRSFEPSPSHVVDMAQAQRGKAIMTAEADGSLRAIHLTAERVYITQATKVAGVPAICFPAKGDGIVTIDGKGGLHHWWMEAPHAEASWKAFFGKVHYEHHDHPKWDWQTSSGTDDVEPKHSLMPLVAGTFKGALYAMLFSIPIAILAAIYTSEFMSFRLRAIIKPVVEIMASLPSVVLGFLVLVVAPLADPNMPAILLFLIIMPAVFMIFGWLWQQMPPVITGKLGPWRTFIVLFVFLGFAAWLCLAIGPRMEYHLFPKTEATDLALIDAKTFRPHNDEIAGRLDAGHFGSWTSGGAELAGRSAQLRKVDHESKAETFSIELVNGVKEKFKQYVASLPPDKVSVDGSGAITVNDESVSLPPGALRLNKDKKIVFKDSAIPAGASITEYGVTTTVLNTLPKGWWNPGGHGLFQVVALFIFIPLVVLGLRVTFTGMGFFKYQFHIWKQREGQWHPLKTVAAIKGRFEGDRSGTLRPVMVDIVFAGLYASLVLAIAYGLVLAVGPWIEGLLFTYDHPTAGQVVDFRRALLGEEGWKFEQKNSFIVGVAMGFAVIPIIYTISEDALQSVPNQLRAASLACGASAWQTAARVAVPAALPGIFSAVVVGLGRAVGETMIVVMAAGGTPIMDMQPFNGFRSLSAAIATEMPEAPQDGTLYRTLFLAGLLLFVMTFVVNTIAEVIRIRLRRKMARV